MQTANRPQFSGWQHGPIQLNFSKSARRQKSDFADFSTPDQTLPVPFIIDEPDCVFRQIFEEYLQRKEIRLDHTIELWSIPTIKNLVAGGLGISFFIETAMNSRLNPTELAGLREETPLGCIGQPQDVAETVAWLASAPSTLTAKSRRHSVGVISVIRPAARFITGQVISPNGGFTIY